LTIKTAKAIGNDMLLIEVQEYAKVNQSKTAKTL